MQTFLPYKDFEKSAHCLDLKRLKNQINEGIVILKTLLGIYEEQGRKGWPHHPATKQWAGYEKKLLEYVLVCRDVYEQRTGVVINVEENIALIQSRIRGDSNKNNPPWLGYDKYHSSHRSNLLRKDESYYSQFLWVEDDTQEYVWPSKLDIFE